VDLIGKPSKNPGGICTRWVGTNDGIREIAPKAQRENPRNKSVGGIKMRKVSLILTPGSGETHEEG